MGFFSQLGLLLWKNALLQRRKVLVSIFEILLPVLFAVIILAIRILTKPTTYSDPIRYDPETVDQYRLNAYLTRVTELGFTPNTSVTNGIMDKVLDDLIRHYEPYLPNSYDPDLTRPPRSFVIGINTNKTFALKGFDSELALEEYYKGNSDRMAMAVVFKDLDGATTLPANVTYYLRPKTEKDERWRTRQTFPFFQTGEPRNSIDPNYRGSGVLMMQSFLAQAMIVEWGGSNDTVSMKIQRMPYPPYVSDPMVTVIQQQLPLFLILSFILSVIQNTKNIVYEKERKLKESMKLMGLIPAAHWTSWFITCFIYLAIAMAIYAILFGVDISDTGPVLAFSDASLFYVFLLVYGIAMITFCFMVSVLVQKANIGAALSGILFFGFYLPNFFLVSRYEEMSYSEKLAACLSFNQAMSFGANVIGLFEGTGEGARWNNIHKTASVDDNFTLLDSIMMLIIDSVIHLIITWYLDNVRPGDYGVPRPLYFCFTPSYWCGSKKNKAGSKAYASGNRTGDHHFEEEPAGLQPGVRICNLRKVYGRNKVAVDNLSLNMYEGQITVLLGHNGAGKTTTMSMLTGFIPPTSGTAYINDYDIRTDIENVRESLGLCPQHNILFGSLSVHEHLVFFAKLKGCPSKDVQSEVDHMIKEVGLEQKRYAPARTLSGGQKRKLSVAIALIAGSKIIVLDEPSSGMDPAARRQTWDVLQRHRAGRTMLLTTHFMDEADLLGDRIAIMAEGVVKCCGTSMFLKKLYGAGYHLVLVKSDQCDVNRVTQEIQSVVPTAQLETEINAEITYLLPDHQSALFPDLFNRLESDKVKLGILNFGASATTLEEVFLRVGENALEEDEKPANGELQGVINPGYDADKGVENGHGNSNVQAMNISSEPPHTDVLAFSKGYNKLSGVMIHASRFYGIVVKKAIHFWRNRTITLVQLLLPVIFTIIALAVDELRPQTLTEPALDFNLGPFGDTTIAYTNGTNANAETDTLATSYGAQFSSNQQRVKVFVDQPSENNSLNNFYINKAADIGTTTYNKRVIVGAQFNNTNNGLELISWYNGQPFHAQPISLTYSLNALVHARLNNSFNILSGINPMPKDEDADAESTLTLALGAGFSVGFCISIGMAFLTTSFIYFLIKEKEGGAKHMQMVSGVGPLIFWSGNLVWDYINYLLPSLLLLAVFAAYGTDAYMEDGRLGLVALILALYGLAILPFIYLTHFLFRSPPTGMVVGIVFNIFSGLITMTTVFVMELIEDVRDLGQTLNWVFLAIFPNHCLSKSFMDVYVNYLNQDFCYNTLKFNPAECLIKTSVCCKGIGMGCGNNSAVCLDYTDNYLSWESPGIGRYLVFMVIHGVVFISLTLMVEYGLFRLLCSSLSFSRPARPAGLPFSMSGGGGGPQEDDDVAAERRRINASPASVLSQRDSLLLVNLYKQYGNFVAVDHTCMGVPEQECFGLLGQNGAGKTTTFKMLTGDVAVSGGNAYLKGFDVKHNLQQVQANMGYCPQFDALIDQMTGRETLTMYGRLRGVPSSHLKTCVNDLIDVLLLRPHADKLTSDYSGGNKRKLSTAMALIGDPPFILLDEPSSGMDPGARRQLWNVLSKVRASGRTLVLTSHSMEECEALCTRLAIMVNGRFVCLGSTQHLKSKFGQGYTLVAKMNTGENGYPAPIDPLVTYIQQVFPSARLFDSHQGYAHMQVPDPQVRLADVFSVMERSKREMNVQDYNVHQTTLEQVFLAFTIAQNPPLEVASSSCFKSCCR